MPTFRRLEKQFTAVNFLLEDLMQRQFGIKGITFDNIEDVYNRHVTGLKTLAETRDYLTERGMSDTWAEKLMFQYLRKVSSESHICTILDLFSNPESKGHLNRAPITEIYANYVNMHRLTPGLLIQDLYQQSKFKPVAPVRMFSTMFSKVESKPTSLEEEKKANAFLDFIKQAEEIDKEITQADHFDFDPNEIDIGFSFDNKQDGDKSKETVDQFESMKRDTQNEQAVTEAMRKYNRKFFG